MTTPGEGPTVRHIPTDFRAVRRLPRPWTRSAAVFLVGALAAVAVYTRLGVRGDAVDLGRGVLWGLSALQACYGVILVVSALGSAVPGRRPTRQGAALLLLVGVALALAVTYVTWARHASYVPAGHEASYRAICLGTPIVVGLPALVVTLLLAFRAYPTRPLATGALAGLGAGLLADGSWRTYCEVSDPSHVLTTHLTSVAALAAAGATIAVGWAWVADGPLRTRGAEPPPGSAQGTDPEVRT